MMEHDGFLQTEPVGNGGRGKIREGTGDTLAHLSSSLKIAYPILECYRVQNAIFTLSQENIYNIIFILFRILGILESKNKHSTFQEIMGYHSIMQI